MEEGGRDGGTVVSCVADAHTDVSPPEDNGPALLAGGSYI